MLQKVHNGVSDLQDLSVNEGRLQWEGSSESYDLIKHFIWFRSISCFPCFSHRNSFVAYQIGILQIWDLSVEQSLPSNSFLATHLTDQGMPQTSLRCLDLETKYHTLFAARACCCQLPLPLCLPPLPGLHAVCKLCWPFLDYIYTPW